MGNGFNNNKKHEEKGEKEEAGKLEVIWIYKFNISLRSIVDSIIYWQEETTVGILIMCNKICHICIEIIIYVSKKHFIEALRFIH